MRPLRVFLRASSSSMRGRKDLYRILGINNDALPAEVRASYILQARRTHPDVCKQPGAEERFKEVRRAYATLIDPQQRKAYDSGASEEDISAASARSRARAEGDDGPRQAWRADPLLYFCRELGVGSPYTYVLRVHLQAEGAYQAARASNDWAPARAFGREHFTLLCLLASATVLTGVPPFLLVTYRCFVVLDRHADALLKPDGVRTWMRSQIVQPLLRMLAWPPWHAPWGHMHAWGWRQGRGSSQPWSAIVRRAWRRRFGDQP